MLKLFLKISMRFPVTSRSGQLQFNELVSLPEKTVESEPEDKAQKKVLPLISSSVIPSPSIITLSDLGYPPHL